MKLFVLLLLCSVAVAQTPSTHPSLTISTATLRSASRTDRGMDLFYTGPVRLAQGDYRSVGDVQYRAGDTMLVSHKHTGDRSTIVDLGEKTWDQLESLPAQTPQDQFIVPAVEGHLYLNHVNDRAVDFWAIMRVTRLSEKNSVCEVEWVRLNVAPPRPAPPIAPDAQNRLADLLVKQDDNVDASFILAEPKVVLQLRAGAGGGNPNRIDMVGEKSIYVRHVSPTTLPLQTPPNMREESRVYFSGGRVPPGKCFVIERVRFHGTADGDSNGHGELIVHAGKTQICQERDVPEVEGGDWQGHIEIRPGEESNVYIEGANSSMGEAIFEGRFIDADAPRQADAGSDKIVAARDPIAVLQLSVGGQPDEIDLLGHCRSTPRSKVPLEFKRTFACREKGLAYSNGFRIPQGKKFIVRLITCQATSDGDENGPGAVRLMVINKTLMNVQSNNAAPRLLEWKGEIEIRPGMEQFVKLYVQNSSMADLRIMGEFVDDH